MAAELIRHQVAVIWANTPGVQAAMAATTTIPIVFTVASDPVNDGLVASLNRPGGNVTGVTLLGVEVASKRLEPIHELVPTATITALLVNPASPLAETTSRALQAASHSFGLQLRILNASTAAEIEEAFATLDQMQAGALVIGSDPLFSSRSEQLAALTIRHAVPPIFQDREFAAAGGLMSYGTDIADSYRLAGTYVGRILRGEKPADLPVQQATKVELYINMNSSPPPGHDIGRSGRTRHESPFGDDRSARLSYRWLRSCSGGAVVGCKPKERSRAQRHSGDIQSFADPAPRRRTYSGGRPSWCIGTYTVSCRALRHVDTHRTDIRGATAWRAVRH
jgi:putative ABC transport system substrate-binding protein